MISLKEYLKNRVQLFDLPQEIQDNILDLLEKVNVIRTAYGKPLKVNDGYRRPEDVPPNGSKKSKHLSGQALDLDDNDAGDLWKWCMDNLQLFKDNGLYLEHGCYTHNKKWGSWVHIQSAKPASGHRIFLPTNDPNPNPDFWDGVYDRKFD